MVYLLEEKISKEKLADFCKNNNIRKLSVFGSFVRGDHSENSDIDILIRFQTTHSLLKLIKIENELSELLGKSGPGN